MPTAYVIEYEQGTNCFGTDPLIDMFSGLSDFGGSTRTFMPLPNSPVIDAGNPFISWGFEQRGRHFTRVYDSLGAGPIVDIGAVEVQSGVFVVDALVDENEGQDSGVWEYIDEFFGIVDILGYDAMGDFALREALEFSEKNPEVDTILFSSALLGAGRPDRVGAADDPARPLRG